MPTGGLGTAEKMREHGTELELPRGVVCETQQASTEVSQRSAEPEGSRAAGEQWRGTCGRCALAPSLQHGHALFSS